MCKIRKFLFLGVILAALVSCTSRTKPYDIYLCIGQSNMAGRGDMLPGDTFRGRRGMRRRPGHA